MNCLSAEENEQLRTLQLKEPYVNEVLHQLQRILASAKFERVQEKARDFLRYVVAMTLFGRTDEIKETTIAIAVWKESADYDPAQTTKVRVAALDLRTRLAEYYDGDGNSEPIKITIPHGAYVPELIERRPAIVVCLFDNWNPNGEHDHLCKTVSDEISHQLLHSGAVRVSRAPAPVANVSAEGYALRGSLSCVDQQVRLNASLSNRSTGRVVLDQSFESGRDDLLRLSRQVAHAVLAILHPENGFHARGGDANERFEARWLHEQGRFHLRRRTPTDIRKSIELFEKAIEANPRLARPYAGLADCLLILSWYEMSTPDRTWFEAAKNYALTAYQLNPGLPDVRTALGYAKLLCDFDWTGAEAELRGAILLENRYAEAHHRLANLLTMQGHFHEAEEEMKRAYDLDPSSIVIRKTRGDPYYYSGRYEQAIAWYQTALRLAPGFWMAHLFLGLAFEQTGDIEHALNEFDAVTATVGVGCAVQGALGHLYARSGRQDEAHAILRRLQEHSGAPYVAPHTLAVIYAGLGDKDRAFEWLEASYESRIELVAWVKVDPRFAALRDDPRFSQFLMRIGLEPPAASPPHIA